MNIVNKEEVIHKIIEMPTERVSKLLIFMAGMEAEHNMQQESEKKKGKAGV